MLPLAPFLLTLSLLRNAQPFMVFELDELNRHVTAAVDTNEADSRCPPWARHRQVAEIVCDCPCKIVVIVLPFEVMAHRGYPKVVDPDLVDKALFAGGANFHAQFVMIVCERQFILVGDIVVDSIASPDGSRLFRGDVKVTHDDTNETRWIADRDKRTFRVTRKRGWQPRKPRRSPWRNLDVWRRFGPVGGFV